MLRSPQRQTRQQRKLMGKVLQNPWLRPPLKADRRAARAASSPRVFGASALSDSVCAYVAVGMATQRVSLGLKQLMRAFLPASC